MKYYYDLHIHSVLSPCADDLMTPNNIFNMANLKKLNIISVTDHNSLKQLSTCYELSQSYDMLFIPGVELEVQEGFHLLCYFKHVDEALAFDAFLESHIHKQRYDHELYGKQAITNLDDEIIDYFPYHLTNSLTLSFEDLLFSLKHYDHILVYAHLNREKNSGLSYLNQYPLDAIELTKHVQAGFIHQHQLTNHKILFNSDAHQIIDISEIKDKNEMELESLTIEAFFEYFKNG